MAKSEKQANVVKNVEELLKKNDYYRNCNGNSFIAAYWQSFDGIKFGDLDSASKICHATSTESILRARRMTQNKFKKFQGKK